MDSLASDTADLSSAFNLRAASQHPERASPEEVLLETHLTVGVVCQATVDLRGAQARVPVETGRGRARTGGLTYDLAAQGRQVLSLQFWHSYTDW